MDNKKYLIISTIMTIILVGVGCSKITPTTLTANLGQTFELSKGQKAQINNTNLVITFKKFVHPEFKCNPGDMCIGPRPDYYVITINNSQFEISSYLYNITKYKEYRVHINMKEPNADKIVIVVYKFNNCEDISDIEVI